MTGPSLLRSPNNRRSKYGNIFSSVSLGGKKRYDGSLLAFAINGLIFSYVAMFLRLPTGRILVLEVSPDDPKRAQHLFFSDIPCLHAAELSTGSVESAFESEKHKKYAKLYLHFAMSEGTSRFHASKEH